MMRYGWGRGFGSPAHIASEYLALQAMNAIPRRTPPPGYVPDDAFSYWFPRIVGVIITLPLIIFLGLLESAFRL